MRTIRKLLLISFLVFTAFGDLFGQGIEKKTSPVRFLFRAGLELGGDKVAEVFFEDGDNQFVKAGQGGSIGIGAEFQVPTVNRLLFHATAGYKFVTTKADNANIRLSRIPVQVTANWMATNKLRFGAGVASHRGIRFKADGLGQDLNFRSAMGPTFELAYSGIGLTYTAMTYEDESNEKYSANAIGLSLTVALPNR